MEPFVVDLARDYVEQLRADGEARFVQLRLDPRPDAYIGMNSNSASGHLVYRRADDPQDTSVRVFVKFISALHRTHQYDVLDMFRKEIRFYTRIAPFLHSLRAVDHLIPAFLHSRDEPAAGLALMFRHLEPRWRCNDYRSLLDYAHLALMARKLGEFHAYSFAARARDSVRFAQLYEFSARSMRLIVGALQADMRRTTERCVRLLGDDARYAAAAPWLARCLGRDFGDFLLRGYECDARDPCWVLNHVSYNQSNVLFAYADDGQPVDLKIMDWQLYLFASLGVDLLAALYLDTSRQTRDAHWDQLIDHYCEALTATFAHVAVPTREQVLRELRKGVGPAILFMTYRITKNVLESHAIWNDQLLVEMLKDMIDRGLLKES